MHNVYLHCDSKTFLAWIHPDCPNVPGHDEESKRKLHKGILSKENIFDLRFEHFHHEWAVGQKLELMGIFSMILWCKHRGTKNKIIFEEFIYFGQPTISNYQLFRKIYITSSLFRSSIEAGLSLSPKTSSISAKHFFKTSWLFPISWIVQIIAADVVSWPETLVSSKVIFKYAVTSKHECVDFFTATFHIDRFILIHRQ